MKFRVFSSFVASVSIVVASLLSAPVNAITFGDTRIINGGIADISNVPWQVALIRSTNGLGTTYNNQICGGSIVDTDWIVTAAHCVTDDFGNEYSASWYFIEAGIETLPNNRTNWVAVDDIIVHPDYDPDAIQNDIALLHLQTDLVLEDNLIETISIADSDILGASFPTAGTSAVISGWGSIAAPDPIYPADLRVATVEVLTSPSATSCGWYGYSYDNLTMLCATDDSNPSAIVDSCWGDSGGPLAVNNSGTWYLTGVVSWGAGCATLNYPGIYTRVTTYTDWLAAEMSGIAPVDPPTFNRFTPSSVSVGGTLTITGTNLDSVTTVTFTGGATAAPTSATSSSLTVVVPDSAQTGRVTVTNSAGSATSRSSLRVVVPTPTVSSVSPSSISVGGTLTISGSNLDTVTEVSFTGGVTAEPATQTANSLTVVVPVGANSGRVTVTNPYGSATSRTSLRIVAPTPTVSSVSPSSISVGATLTISGSNLDTVTEVSFTGGVTAEPATQTANSLTVVVPVGANSGRVTVTNPYGSATSRTSLRIVAPTPTVSNLSPSRVSIGTTITITGTNLDTVSLITFTGGVTAIPATQTANSLTVVVPVGANSGRVTVTNPYGSATSRTSLRIS